MEFLTLQVESVLNAEKELPGSIIEQDGMTYIAVELLLAIIEQTIENNIHNPKHEENDRLGMAIVMQGLQSSMHWATQLMEVKNFQKSLESM